MGLSKFRLGDLIEPCEERNENLLYGLNSVKGISILKKFIETKADMEGVSLKPYFIVKPDDFAYVTVTSRNGGKITLAHNTSNETFICSSSYVVFRVKEKNSLLSDFLFMYFNRPEFDRYARFCSWGSAREIFSFEEMCDIEITLPSVEIQQKFVEIYRAMILNSQSYERGLEDLKLCCDAYIENLRKQTPCETIGQYIEETNLKNADKYGVEFIKGISINKEFIETKADTNDLSSVGYKIVKNGEFSFNPNTARMGDKFSIALNNTDKDILVSSIYPVFKTKDINPEYFMANVNRSEFERKGWFFCDTSARGSLSWDEFLNLTIPNANEKEQEIISNLYNAQTIRLKISENLRAKIQQICPILIRGAMREGER